MNVRALDLLIRSVTTSLLAVVIVVAAAYEDAHSGTVGAFLSYSATLIVGVYFGAHIAQNATGQRARRDQVIAAEAKDEEPARDDAAMLRQK